MTGHEVLLKRRCSERPQHSRYLMTKQPCVVTLSSYLIHIVGLRTLNGLRFCSLSLLSLPLNFFLSLLVPFISLCLSPFSPSPLPPTSFKPFAIPPTMTNAYTFDGLIVFSLLVICTCAYIKTVPRLKQLFLSEKKGLWGTLYKAAVIGTRLHWVVSTSCVLMAVYVMFIK